MHDLTPAAAPRFQGREAASSTFSTMRQLGGAFGLAVLVAVFAGAGSYASPPAFTDGSSPPSLPASPSRAARM
jgi:hypothetical protein